MSDDAKAPERVTFSRGYGVCIMGIDGTWRRDCLLNAISDNDAILTVEGSIQGLNLKEFFLLLSSTGLAYRRCELVRVNGAEIDVSFLKGKNKKKRANAMSNGCDDRLRAAPRLAGRGAQMDGVDAVASPAATDAGDGPGRAGPSTDHK